MRAPLIIIRAKETINIKIKPFESFFLFGLDAAVFGIEVCTKFTHGLFGSICGGAIWFGFMLAWSAGFLIVGVWIIFWGFGGVGLWSWVSWGWGGLVWGCWVCFSGFWFSWLGGWLVGNCCLMFWMFGPIKFIADSISSVLYPALRRVFFADNLLVN